MSDSTRLQATQAAKLDASWIGSTVTVTFPGRPPGSGVTGVLSDFEVGSQLVQLYMRGVRVPVAPTATVSRGSLDLA